MMDIVTTDKRSWNMKRIRNRHTKPELIIRSLLHRTGFRFRIHSCDLPGSPDIILPKYKTVIFVHGCFWHRHVDCPKATTPGTNKKYWQKKFDRNMLRDIEVNKELKKLGWDVIVVWECEIMKNPLMILKEIVRRLDNTDYPTYSLDINRQQIIKIAEKKNRYYLDNKR